ncbi:hypothetical protein M422DRAFT_32557 [Sphaerobolus stellatus SS14]|uniref:Unplaced genomic scaffold SPHSTscaffold_74, whole genome shotgun sequence n=1 Tax=Sphaerobolus stellatus (strain SS14) TaxID=990650 RepID=A0A0C9VEB1_SPHS4|nr:hypothetical protein M422DRAFT_32557 [Sphaerobolus stellatus SS14]
MPKYLEWKTYAKYAKQYGEITYLNVFGTHLVFLNSRRMVHELFERRSSNYSDRTTFPMIVDLMGFGWALTFQGYGEWWRRHRRAMHDKFHPSAVEAYKPIQIKHTRDLLRRLHKAPEDFIKHIRHTAGAIIMESENDPYILTAEKALNAAGEAGVPGRFTVDMLPWMKYIPEWVPGASFKKQARIWRKYILDMADLPFEHVKAQMANGTAQPSFTSTHLERLAAAKYAPADAEQVIKNTAAVIFAGGSDTTVKTLITFVLAMVLFPDVQKKVQEELDGVLGGVRLPEFEDMAALPYTIATYKEAMRWHPLVPMGVAHAATQDDVIDGYFIPKGALVFGNSWFLLREEADFGPDTEKFDPGRFMEPGRRDPGQTGAFGYGRRVCPGRYMAENSLFIAVASILQNFDITPTRDSSGKEVMPEYEWTSGFFSSPTDYQCTIKPRSKVAEERILSTPAEV